MSLRISLLSVFLFTTTNSSAFSVCQVAHLFESKAIKAGFHRETIVMRSTEKELKEEAETLMKRAKELRASIPEKDKQEANRSSKISSNTVVEMPWTVSEDSDTPGVGYRLYIDIGREDGTWMEPRWGGSGKRIEFSMDVRFLAGDDAIADEPVQKTMVKDNFGGKSSPVYVLKSADNARLRGGFERMKCYGGGHRIDAGKNNVTRFYAEVEGTPERGSIYGDIFVPKGPLFFSLPCFGSGMSNLSTREGPITVRQIGWHTGWRREESRIVGVFRAVPIETARKRDKF